ncbi:unnamed protein product [Lactuca saligna]|uniref:Nodulin-like domain-containing protein n=1 Tax=Lactuca saligna TaxID=75948 RepID=A0AA35YUY6_LACSI|nr:unnamed protein product [Lactuca saligna]
MPALKEGSRPPWVGLAAAVWVQVASGNSYRAWVVLLIGVLACFFGYGVIWLAVTETVHNLPYWFNDEDYGRYTEKEIVVGRWPHFDFMGSEFVTKMDNMEMEINGWGR